MTNEEAINTLNSLKQYYNDKNEDSYVGFDNEDNEALDMAIKALEQQPCEECISREAVKEMLSEEWTKYMPMEMDVNLSFVLEKISELPSVTPQPKIERWRHYEGMLICSECGAEFYDDIMEYCGDDVPRCCPNCGAKMEVEE